LLLFAPLLLFIFSPPQINNRCFNISTSRPRISCWEPSLCSMLHPIDTQFYEVWTFNINYPEMGISQAGVLLTQENCRDDDFFDPAIYYTSNRPRSNRPPNPRDAGGDTIYKGKIFGADIPHFKKICENVSKRAERKSMQLNNAMDWIFCWDKDMDRPDVAHIMFDRPRPDEEPILRSEGRNEHETSPPPSQPSSSSSSSNSPHLERRYSTNQPRRQASRRGREIDRRPSRGSSVPARPRSHANKDREPPRRRRDSCTHCHRCRHDDDYDSDSDSDTSSRSPRRCCRGGGTRRGRHGRQVPDPDDYEDPKMRRKMKKNHWAELIAETVAATALGDIFMLGWQSVFQKALNHIF